MTASSIVSRLARGATLLAAGGVLLAGTNGASAKSGIDAGQRPNIAVSDVKTPIWSKTGLQQNIDEGFTRRGR